MLSAAEVVGSLVLNGLELSPRGSTEGVVLGGGSWWSSFLSFSELFFPSGVVWFLCGGKLTAAAALPLTTDRQKKPKQRT